MAAEKEWRVPESVLKYVDLVYEKFQRILHTVITWLNSVCFFTVQLQQRNEESKEYESFEREENEGKIDGRIVLVKDVLRKICIVVYLILAVFLSLLLVF